ncbi:MAG: pyroglutamyl-peptidase I family protein [Candidatus Binatia bacterium]
MPRLSRKSPVRVLLYGFGPYHKFTENITAEIIESLAPRPGMGKIVFPVRFQRRQFVEALRTPMPLMVVGLGQSSRPRIEVETRATNRRRASKSGAPRSITAGGKAWMPAPMPLKVTRPAAKSINAGDYVCNFSMYVMLEELERQDHNSRFAFVHIPFNHDFQAACRYVERIVGKCFNIADKLGRDRAAKRLGG